MLIYCSKETFIIIIIIIVEKSFATLYFCGNSDTFFQKNIILETEISNIINVFILIYIIICYANRTETVKESNKFVKHKQIVTFVPVAQW